MGNEPSSLVSDSSSTSTYLVICDDKKPNLFLKKLILSSAIIARFLFFSLKFSRKPVVRDVLLLLLDEADSGLKECSDSRSLLFEISEHPLVFRIFQLYSKNFCSKVLNLIDSSVNLYLVYRVNRWLKKIFCKLTRRYLRFNILNA